MNEQTSQVRVWPQTRQKLEAIAETRRWKLGAAVDALCDDYIAREGITVKGTNSFRRPRRQATASAQ